MTAIFRSLKRAYDLRLSVKCLALLLLFGAALLLERIAGGFPPPAWRVLAQAAPQLSSLFSTRGLPVFAPFAGLLVLSTTWAALWLVLAWTALVLVWRAWFPARRTHSQAIRWQRTSFDNLLDSGFDEPQATLAYASAYDSAYTSFDQVASPSTPFPDIPTHPEPRPHPASQQAPNPVGARRTGGADLNGHPTEEGHYSDRPPKQERRASRPPQKARPGSRPPRGEHPRPRPMADNPKGQPTTRQTTVILTDVETRTKAAEPTASTWPTDATQKVGIGWNAGITRKNKPNEDSVLALHSACPFRGQLMPFSLYAVADGMGGHANGQVASHLATHSLMQSVLPAVQHGEELTEEFLIETMVDCAHLANQAVFQFREDHATDLGTTLTAALVA
ncbi:MAG TPA: protein phosphatase 2C domain-containing protein, partial [Ktedonobacteraceae bacterium]|nr:protein phosphatase 2C domain-containing protein [Ktedonobacteraceae bacterium]